MKIIPKETNGRLPGLLQIKNLDKFIKHLKPKAEGQGSYSLSCFRFLINAKLKRTGGTQQIFAKQFFFFLIITEPSVFGF